MELSADTPEVVRLRAAVEELNEAEDELVRDLHATTDQERAAELCRRVGAARSEFADAVDAVEALSGEGVV